MAGAEDLGCGEFVSWSAWTWAERAKGKGKLREKGLSLAVGAEFLSDYGRYEHTVPEFDR